MNQTIIFLLYFVTGISFAFGIVNLVIGSQKGGEKSYLLFGLIGLFVGGYYLCYLNMDNYPYNDLIVRLGFLFFLSVFALLPWFFSYYSGYRNRKIQWILSVGMGITYLLLLFTRTNTPPVIWNIVGHIIVIGIIGFGFISARYQIRSGYKISGWYLFVALIPFLVLTIDDIIYVHFNNIYPFSFPEGFLPFDYFPVLFMIIMGIKLARDIQQHIYLQKEIIVKEKRWSEMLEKVQLLVIRLDTSGIISYANPYFLDITKYDKREILGKDWFSLFLPGKIKSDLFETFKEHLEYDSHPQFKNSIVSKNGDEIIVEWSNVQITDQKGVPIGSLSIGADITDREHAFNEITELKNRLEKDNLDLKEKIYDSSIGNEIVGKSDEITYTIQRALRVAPTDSSVLLEGETGVGKEVFANMIHRHSTRNKGPFVKINCTALPRELFESELFGHEKGSFTGALQQKKGFFELADKGTIFLDEIGELPIELQPKLLRVLQNGEFVRIGGQKPIKVDVRIISATNSELMDHVAKGLFREDLFYRLNVYPITVPPLRNRKGDIQLLVNHFVRRLSKKMDKQFKSISRHDLSQLQKYPWPGNVRELENMIERAIITSEEPVLKFDLDDFDTKSVNGLRSQMKSLEEAEREHILTILEECKWKINGKDGAAYKLNLPPSTLRSKMKKLSILRPAK